MTPAATPIVTFQHDLCHDLPGSFAVAGPLMLTVTQVATPKTVITAVTPISDLWSGHINHQAEGHEYEPQQQLHHSSRDLRSYSGIELYFSLVFWTIDLHRSARISDLRHEKQLTSAVTPFDFPNTNASRDLNNNPTRR